MKLRLVFTAVVLLILAGVAPSALGQRRTTRPSKGAAPQPARRDQAVEPGTDSYWAAQRNIEAAIQRLGEYLRRSPDGEYASAARRQLAALRGLTATPARPEWVSMGSLPLRDVPEWRVAAVDLQADKTRLTVEIVCRREDGGDCYFDPFGRSPLVLIDNSGRYYPMLEAGPLPADIRYRDRDNERAILSGGRTVTVTVDFAPLAEGAVSGQVYYRENNQAKPARFSLSSRR
jgi:hypothetical protein